MAKGHFQCSIHAYRMSQPSPTPKNMTNTNQNYLCSHLQIIFMTLTEQYNDFLLLACVFDKILLRVMYLVLPQIPKE